MNMIIETKRDHLWRLCQEYAVQRLEAFGSATTAAFDPARSDLDFLVVFETTTPEQHAERYFGLLAALQDLFECDIDLVELGAIRNPYFLKGIAASRALVYGE